MVVEWFKALAAKLEEWTEPIRDYVAANHNNPIMWIIIFVAGLAIFGFTYSTLHRE